MKANQRFIAGAVCPACQAMDALQLDLDSQTIHCVDCGFSQTSEQRDQPKPKPQAAGSGRTKLNQIPTKNLS